jgi:iron(III) transport system substrate-binding protein
MRKRAWSVLSAGNPLLASCLCLLLFMSGCAPPDGSPPPAASAPQAAASSHPTGQPGSPEWAAIVAAAKREGKVVVLGPPGADARDGLTRGFSQGYPDILVEYQAATGSQAAPKLLTERQAGQYLADVYIGGITTPLLDLMPVGALDPVPPYLVGPATWNPSVWRDGKLEYVDNAGQYVLVFSTYVQSPLAYNPTLVASGEIRSFHDLLAPKWRGRIAMFDPRVAGKGLGLASTF